MPEPGNAPSALQSLLDKVYKSARKDYDKGRASKIAWGAAKNAGWYKKGGKWTRKKESSEASFWNWKNYWTRVEYGSEAIPTVKVKESLVPFKARILLAVPGKSLNNRIYSKEALAQCAPLYEGKPFILDHNIEDANRVVGIFSRGEYTTERSQFTGQPHTGLWASAVGLMEQDLFDKIKGTPLIPPLIRNVSIGGQGDGDYNVDGGTLIKNFVPAEGSLTAFPGIPQAHIAMIEQIRESLERKAGLRRGPEPKQEVNLPPKGNWHETPYEEAEKIAIREKQRLGEGPWMPSIPPNRADLRGADARPDSQQYQYNWTPPQATTSSNSGYQPKPGNYNAPQTQGIMAVTGAPPDGGQGNYPSPGTFTQDPNQYTRWMRGQSSTEDAPGTAGSPGSKDAKSWTGAQKTPKMGRTSTQTTGFPTPNPAWKGMSDQDEEEERHRKQFVINSLAKDLNKVLNHMKGTREQEEEEEEEAKIDVSKPEEEEEGEEERLFQSLAKLEARRIQREVDADLGNQKGPWTGIGYGSMPTSYSRTLNTGPRVSATHQPPNENEPGKMKPLYSAGKKAGAFARSYEMKKGEEEEEEEEEHRKLLVQRLVQLRMNRYGQEAVPGAEPRSNAPIPKTPKLGYSTTKTPGYGKLSPSGTGMTDQPEEEEEEAMGTGTSGLSMPQMVSGKRKREQMPSDVDKTEKPPGEEEEEEAMPRMPTDLLKAEDGTDITGNPIMKTQRDPDRDGDQDFTVANPIRSDGEEEEEEEERHIIPDLTPDDFHAPAFPPASGIEKLLLTLHPEGRPSEKKTAEAIEMWRRLKTPKPEPTPKVVVQVPREKKPGRTLQMRESSANPAVSREMNTLLGIPAHGYAPVMPTFTGPAQSMGTASIVERATQIMEQQKQRPFGSHNLAHNIFMEMLARGEVMEIRR